MLPTRSGVSMTTAWPRNPRLATRALFCKRHISPRRSQDYRSLLARQVGKKGYHKKNSRGGDP